MKKSPTTPLECAVTQKRACNSFRIHSYKFIGLKLPWNDTLTKNRGCGGVPQKWKREENSAKDLLPSSLGSAGAPRAENARRTDHRECQSLGLPRRSRRFGCCALVAGRRSPIACLGVFCGSVLFSSQLCFHFSFRGTHMNKWRDRWAL